MTGKHPLIERAQRAEQRLKGTRARVREAYEYILPGMTHDLDPADGDAPERPAVTDSTAVEGAFRYADRFMTRYTPPNESFVALRPGIQLEFFEAAALDDVRQALDQTMEVFHRLLEISNFHQTVHRAYLDYSISTGAFNFNETANPNDPFSFEAVSLPQLVPEEGPRGTAKTSFRKFKVLPQNIVSTWPDAKLPDALARKVERRGEEQGAEERVLLLEALVWDAATDGYDYAVIWVGEGVELVRRKVGTGARVVFRNMLPAGGVLGIGPGLRQLPNIRQLNKLIEVASVGREMDQLPTYQAPYDHPLFAQGGVLDLAPGLVLPAGPSGGLSPLPRTGAGIAAAPDIERLQGQIRAAFGDDGLPPMGGKVLSPTEIVQRTRDDLERFEPSATRLDSEMLRPVARRGVDILQRRGIIGPIRIDGLRVKIMADGPLARLRRQNEARARLSWAGEVIAGLGAEVVYATTDAEGFGADLLEDGGIEPQFVLDEDERAERRQAALEEQMAMAQEQGQA